MIKKICEYCGQEFSAANITVKICNRQHYSKCVVCGKEFPVTRSSIVNKSIEGTCSKQC